MSVITVRIKYHRVSMKTLNENTMNGHFLFLHDQM